MDYPIDLVLRVNEIYHDVEGQDYEERHPEIFAGEAARWKAIGQSLLAGNSSKIRVLDVGSGTGFVPLQIGPFLNKDDQLICSDVSANMLRVCEAALSHRFEFSIEYLKLDGKTIDLASDSLDYVTLNSVLHHVPDLSIFFKEIDRLMKTGGRLIICHEPNRRFYAHGFLWHNSRFTEMLMSPRKLIGLMLRKLGLYDLVRTVFTVSDPGVQRHRAIADDVNRRLLDERVIDAPLSSSQVAEIVDIHSPTAGGGRHKDRGIDVSEIVARYLPEYEVESLETYGHLPDVSRNRIVRWYDSVLARVFPDAGATLLVILRKT